MIVLGAGAMLGLSASDAQANEPETRVFINGTLHKVTFNDGDSFRVLSGAKKDVRARLVGFNTLESHGPVHQWGNWHVKELYHLAKMATLHARRGVWKCETDWNLDTYGRTLMQCPGLGEELIRLGYAHALSIDDTPAAASFLAAQKEAIAAKRGIWAHGVPPFVVTSIHTVEESRDGKPVYNRIVSTMDGHSATWAHRESYKECEMVCHVVYPVDNAAVATVTNALRKDARAQPFVSGLSDGALLSLVRDFATYRHINRSVPRDKRGELKAVLDEYVAGGQFGKAQSARSSCMVHVDFKRRYGNTKAACLKK